MRVCRPLNGRPCDGSTSVSAGIARIRSIESRYSVSGSDSGSMSVTLTFVEMRGSTMSPLISTPRARVVQGHVLGRVAVADVAAPRVARAAGPISTVPPSSRRRYDKGTAGTRLL